MQYVEATVEAVAKTDKPAGNVPARGVKVQEDIPGRHSSGWISVQGDSRFTAAGLKKGQRIKLGYEQNGQYTNYKSVEVVGGVPAASGGGGRSYSGGGDSGLRIARQSSLNRVVDLVVVDKLDIKGKTNGEKLAQMLTLAEGIANWVENGPKQEKVVEPEPNTEPPVTDIDDELPF